MAYLLSIGTLICTIMIVQCEDCTDKFPICLQWAKEGQCDKNSKRMLGNCNAACRRNCTDPKVAFPTCSDEKEKCGRWKAAGQCTKVTDYMMRQCPKACGFCNKPTDGQPYPTEAKAYLAKIRNGTITIATRATLPTPTKVTGGKK